MSETRPTYEQLEKRCQDAEAMLQSILSGETDTVDSDLGRLVIRLAESEERERHIRQVLTAIRNVNQLIVQENDSQRLIEAAVLNLTKTMGYQSAWIALLNEDNTAATMSAGSGFRSGFETLRQKLAEGEFPRCVWAALETDETTVVENPEEAFRDCPLVWAGEGMSCLAHRLAMGDRTFGVLVASVATRFATHEEEKGLFEEVAGDLGFAIAKIKESAALKESRRRYQEIFEGSRDGFVMVDSSARILNANKAYCEMLGYSLEEVRRLESFYAITPERWHRFEQEEIWRKRLLKQGYSGVYEKEYIRKDGTVFPVELQAYSVFDAGGEPEYLWAVVRDVTEQKETQEAYSRFCELATEMICVADVPNATFLQVNPAFERILGYEESELLSRPFLDFVHPDDLQATVGVIDDMLSRGADVASFQNRYRCKDGTYRWLEWNAYSVAEEGLTFAIAHDVTDRKTSERALRESEEKYRALIMQSADCLILHDLDANILDVNSWSCNTYGYTRDELLGMKVSDLDPDYAQRESGGFWERLAPGTPVMFEGRQKRRNGTIFPVEVRLSLIELRGRKLVLALCRDISERKTAERTLRQSEEKHRRLFETMAQGVVYQSADGRIIDANPAAVELLGPTWEELEGKTSHDADWEAVREDGSPFPGDEHPAMLALRTGQPVRSVTMGIRNRRADRTVWIIVNATPLFRPEEKTPYEVCTTFTDITNRKETETALRISESHLRRAQEVAHVGDWEFDFDRGLVRASDETRRIYGLGENEVSVETAQRVPKAEYRPMLDEALNGLRERGEPYNVEFEIRRPSDGASRWVHSVAEFDPDRNVVFGVLQDITERKRAERALRESEERFRAIFEHMAAASCLDEVVYEDGKAVDYRILDVNPAYERLVGKPKSEVVGGLASELYGLDEAPFLDIYTKVAETGEPAAFESYFAPINKFLEVTVSRPAPGRFSTVFYDITERKMAETARRESERRLRTLLGNLPGMAYRCLMRPEWPMEFLSEGCLSLTGYAVDDIIGGAKFHYGDIIVPEDRESVLVAIETAVRNEEPYELEYRITTADGELRWVWERGRAVGTNDRRETVLEGFITDVTDRKRAEADRERLLFAIEQSGEIILVTDADANIQYANSAFARITGYPVDEVIGRNPRLLKSGEQDEEFYRRLWKTISSGRMWQGHFVNRRKDGTLYTEDATISPVLDEDGKIVNYVGVKRDMTKELELEDKVRQSQKLEAIGQLAGGVAHDFNNLLLVINGYSEMAYEKLADDHPAKPAIDGVMKAGTRAATLVSQLLAFSRRQIMRPEDVDLNEVIGDLMKMLARIIGEHIRLDFVPGHQLGAVHADRGMLEQIVMNLCVNARDAMPEGGALTIETENVYINGDYVESHPWARPGRYVLLSVTDTGCGMNEATLKRIFEPFFTTKEVGKGTGLGLATVYGIIQQHEGMIQPYSELGKGTAFKVYLPITQRRAVEIGTKVEGSPQGGTETILLAEDDEAVLTMVRELLERVGYTVLTARNGTEALELFRDQRDHVDLALLDVVMPEMGGKEVFDRMQETEPGFRVLFASGYSENAVHTNFVLKESLRLLQKPYDPAELYRAIREALDS